MRARQTVGPFSLLTYCKNVFLQIVLEYAFFKIEIKSYEDERQKGLESINDNTCGI